MTKKVDRPKSTSGRSGTSAPGFPVSWDNPHRRIMATLRSFQSTRAQAQPPSVRTLALNELVRDVEWSPALLRDWEHAQPRRPQAATDEEFGTALRVRAAMIAERAVAEAAKLLLAAGEREAATIAEALLCSILAKDLAALQVKNGPLQWARAYCVSKYGSDWALETFPTRALAARTFLLDVERFAQDPIGLGLDRKPSWEGHELDPDCIDDSVGWFFARLASEASSRSGLVDRIYWDPDDPEDELYVPLTKGIRAALRALRRRRRFDAKALAVAVLVGWGLTPDEARNRLKDKDV